MVGNVRFYLVEFIGIFRIWGVILRYLMVRNIWKFYREIFRNFIISLGKKI